MANTYTLISSNVLSSLASSVTFSAIPSTYKDLVIRITARANTLSAVDTVLGLSFNGSTTSRSSTTLNGSGSAASSTRSTTGFNMVEMTANTATANTFGSSEVYIPNYAGSANKCFSAFGVAETNATAVTMGVQGLLWSNTAAITSITIDTDGVGNFAIGSSFYLYGIKNS